MDIGAAANSHRLARLAEIALIALKKRFDKWRIRRHIVGRCHRTILHLEALLPEHDSDLLRQVLLCRAERRSAVKLRRQLSILKLQDIQTERQFAALLIAKINPKRLPVAVSERKELSQSQECMSRLRPCKRKPADEKKQGCQGIDGAVVRHGRMACLPLDMNELTVALQLPGHSRLCLLLCLSRSLFKLLLRQSPERGIRSPRHDICL